MADEDGALATMKGFSFGSVLQDLDLPTQGLNELGLDGLGIPDLAGWEGGIGVGEGEDYEGEVDAEMLEEEDDIFEDDDAVAASGKDGVKVEAESPRPIRPGVKTKIIKRTVKKQVTRLKPVQKPKTVYELFPGFEKGKVLDFSELFKSYTVKRSRLSKRPLNLEVVNPKWRDVPRGYLAAVVGDARREVETKRDQRAVAASSLDDDLHRVLEDRAGLTKSGVTMSLDDRSFDPILLSNWEDQIIYSPAHAPKHHPASRPDLTTPTNAVLESGIWTQSIIWDAKAPFRDFTQLELHEDDATAPGVVIEQPHVERPRKRARTDHGPPRDKYNLSNDHLYEASKDGGRHRVRQTFGNLVVQHAYPALKLQLPFYKTRLSKQEARSFHRPALQFPANIELKFSKVRSAKKKKDKNGRKLGKGGDIAEGMKKTADLSLKDTSNFVLWEYSEEHPPVIPNFGMGSVLVNYYRKKDEKDEHIPKYDLGEPFVLEPADDTPFLKFGSVDPGQTIPALYNNLVRAPLFRHKPYPTDFLVIRNTIKGEAKYYIREIKNLFVVGQTYPVVEVPGPHSRKITNTIKFRLQLIAYKLLKKMDQERLKINRLMKYFPDQNELQMRQRLKEFMEYHRKGPHQGFWRLKEKFPIPSDEDMLKLLTPESVVLSESMQVGQRHLLDLGYGGAGNEEDGDESKLDIEQQLAPWITTKNFLYATQSKAMLKLHGEGDPTGRGEAFSFIRVSMKEIFVRAGEDYEEKMAEADNRPKSAHRYNVAQQQQIYRSEIDRIWRAQFSSLSRKDEPTLTEQDEVRFDQKKKRPPRPPGPRNMSPFTVTPGMSPLAMSPPADMPSAPSSPTYSRGSSLDRDMSVGPDGGVGNKVLRVKRLIDGVWKTEIIRDSAVIAAYVRRRRHIEEQALRAEDISPTGNEEVDARAKKLLELELARLKKNQERRIQRKQLKGEVTGNVPAGLKKIKPDTTRRCGHCGEVGHMKTNRKCPLWAQFNQQGGAAGAASAAATTPTPTPGPSTLGFGFPSAAPAAPIPPTPQSGPFTRTPSAPFGYPAAVPSPLATSPPVSGFDDATIDPELAGAASPSAGNGGVPKVKLMLGGKKS